MQKKGRRTATFVTIAPLLLGWILSFLVKTKVGFMFINIFHSFSIGGAVAISSIIVSEYCAPRYRAAFLMSETVMLSMGILISHLCGVFTYLNLIPSFGILTASYSILITYLSPESPYWLITQNHLIKCTEVFYWLRGENEESKKEINHLLKTYKAKIQENALRPIINMSLRNKIVSYLQNLMKTDFLKPLSIMILLFSFVGFGGESLAINFSFRDIFNLTNGKYIGTIILDVITLVCSLTACVLVQLVKRKTLFLFTGSVSILFLMATTLFVFLQTLGMISPDHTWLFLAFGTLFTMFMSLGTTALPFSLLGEIFPLSYKGVGSSLTCAYLWAFGNSILRFVPHLSRTIGIHTILFVFIACMIIILIILSKLLPETGADSLVDIEHFITSDKNVNNIYEVVNEDEVESFDKLRLFIEDVI